MFHKGVFGSAKDTKKWLEKLNWKKILLIGLIYTVFATIVHQFEAIITMQYYQMPQYFGVWSKNLSTVLGTKGCGWKTTTGFDSF